MTALTVCLRIMDWVAGLYAIYGLDDVINSLYKNYGLGSRSVCDLWTG